MEEAIIKYGKAVDHNPANPIFYFNRGNCYLQQKEFIKADNDYDMAIELDNSNAKFWHAKGLVFQT